jgi:hypothetical protein
MDLTPFIESVAPEPIALGGFSDLYLGYLVEPLTSHKIKVNIVKKYLFGY